MHLTVENGPLAGTSFPLERDAPVTIGRGEDNSLRINDPGVADHHIVIKALKGEGFGLKALAPGVRVNGREIDASRLQEGDRLELGSTRIGFEHAPTEPRRQLRGFRLFEELGRGGMGVVYRAEQVSLNREVALKLLSHQLTEDPVFVARFVAEARAAARLHHPNVVQVFDVDHDGDTYYYSMELMHEGSLEDWLRKNGKMPVDQALQVIAHAAAGLKYAESLGIVHRDIKPDNLMLDRHGTAKIADLGLALTEEDTQGKVTGTPHFMAPEQVLRKPIDHRTDLYALGCTFYRLVTGRTPFRGNTVKDILRAHVKEAPEPVNKIDAEVPAEVATIIQRLLEKEPDDRYDSADELLEDLETFLVPPSRKGLWIALTATAVLVAGAALTYALTRKDKEPTVIETYRDNPEAARLAGENRELKAKVAYLEARLQHDSGPALAAALEAVVSNHPDSTVAAQARLEASRIREDEARLAREGAARARAVKAAATQLESATRTAIAAGDYRQALELLEGKNIDDELRGTEKLQAVMATLRQSLQEAADARLAALHEPVTDAIAAADPDALHKALDALSGVLDPKSDWPRELLGDVDGLRELLSTGRQTVGELRTARAASIEAGAWERYQGLLSDSVLTAIGAMDFAGAGATVEAAISELGQPTAADSARALAVVLRRAEQFLQRLETAAAAGELQFRVADGRLMTVTGFRRHGPEAGLRVQENSRRNKQELVTLADLGEAQWEALTGLVAPRTEADAGERTCFLALRSIQAHAVQGRLYLGRLDLANDDSGTGAGGYPFSSATLELLSRRLPHGANGEREPWARFLGGELRASRLLASGLRALSERRNLAAAANLEKLIAEHPHSLVRVALP